MHYQDEELFLVGGGGRSNITAEGGKPSANTGVEAASRASCVPILHNACTRHTPAAETICQTWLPDLSPSHTPPRDIAFRYWWRGCADALTVLS